jgi:GNAT superfamily N-acetyltransferase
VFLFYFEGEKAMKELKFIQIEKENLKHFEEFKNLMLPYNEELDMHKAKVKVTPEETILKYTQGMINMQGPNDRHLELCYEDDNLIGFHYGKVDHEGHKGFIKPGYGYIMEFYVVPQYRRKGYGSLMFKRLESLFQGHNVKRMYLTADKVTGEPFWKSLGFEFLGEVSPENKQDILEKDVAVSNEMLGKKINNTTEQIVIQTSDFPDDELIYNIAKCRYPEKIDYYIKWVNKYFNSARLSNDCFLVTAADGEENVLGVVSFERSESDMRRWLMANLYVSGTNRRKNIATLLIKAGLNKVRDEKGNTVCSYIDNNNYPSLNLHKKLEFIEKEKKPFNNLIINEDQVMLEKTIPNQITIRELEEDQVVFIATFMHEQATLQALHSIKRSFNRWKDIYKQWQEDKSEKVFVVFYGSMPVGWLKLNGFDNTDKAWISMLVIGAKFQRMGIGRYTISLAENYLAEKGYNTVGINTTEDNKVARNLYESCGYTVINNDHCVTEDGQENRRYSFEKKLLAGR